MIDLLDGTLVAMLVLRLSTAFCLHARVDKTFVSALTEPDVVIVVKAIPVPADTDVTVPDPPEDGIA